MKIYFMTPKHLSLSLRSQFVSALLLVFTIFTIFGMATPAIATGLFDLPDFNADEVWIVDTADAISSTNQGKLAKNLQELAGETGQEVRMVAIRRLDYGETVDSLGNTIFKDWYPTPEAQANQTLILMDTLTNKAAIITGKSAQALVSPDIANSIVEETVGYNIRKGGKYNQAFIDAGDRLTALLSGQEDPGPPAIEDEIQIEGTFTTAEDTDQGSATIWVIGFLIFATVIPMATYYWYVGLGN